MYEVYRDVVHKVFPNCICILDYFHLSQDFHKKMNEVRIKVMNVFNYNCHSVMVCHYLSNIKKRRSSLPVRTIQAVL